MKNYSCDLFTTQHYARGKTEGAGGAESSVKVHVTTDEKAVEAWIEKHVVVPDIRVLGFDVEWPPVMRSGEYNKVALIQLATSTHVLLVQVAHMPNARAGGERFPASLRDVIQSTRVAKVGVGVYEDLVKVTRDFGLEVGDTAFLELGRIAKGTVQACRYGLVGLTESLVGLAAKKSKKVQMSNWATRLLSREQKTYAAYDALMSLDVYSAMVRLGALPAFGSAAAEEHARTHAVAEAEALLQVIVDSVAVEHTEKVLLVFPARAGEEPGAKPIHVHSREHFRKMYLWALQSSGAQEIAERLMRRADDALLQHLEADMDSYLNEIRTGAPSRSNDKNHFRLLLTILLSRLGMHWTTYATQLDGGVRVSILQEGRALGSATGRNKAMATEMAALGVCADLLRTLRALPNRYYFKLCSGKMTVEQGMQGTDPAAAALHDYISNAPYQDANFRSFW